MMEERGDNGVIPEEDEQMEMEGDQNYDLWEEAP